MGEIKAAIFTTHVPRLMITDLAARKAYMGDNVSTFYDAMERLERERLRGLDFDTGPQDQPAPRRSAFTVASVPSVA